MDGESKEEFLHDFLPTSKKRKTTCLNDAHASIIPAVTEDVSRLQILIPWTYLGATGQCFATNVNPALKFRSYVLASQRTATVATLMLANTEKLCGWARYRSCKHSTWRVGSSTVEPPRTHKFDWFCSLAAGTKDLRELHQSRQWRHGAPFKGDHPATNNYYYCNNKIKSFLKQQ